MDVDIPTQLHGTRLDRALVTLFPEHSRSTLQRWISDGAVTLNGRVCLDRNARLKISDSLLSLTPPDLPRTAWIPINQPIEVLYEDETLLIINKAAGMVVHPGAGTPPETLANALLYHFPELATLPRVGLVHRLDKETTGLLVVAKTLQAHRALVTAMQARTIQRDYAAIVLGETAIQGEVNLPMRRHSSKRTQMAVCSCGGRTALTHYQRLERFRAHSYLRVRLQTGRTHQIRVHCAAIGHPIVGDPCYGRPWAPKAGLSQLHACVAQQARQALHAMHLTLQHPRSGAWMSWSAPLPADMVALLHGLREDARAAGLNF